MFMNINATFTNISYCPLVCDTINKQADDYQRFHPNAFSADKKKRKKKDIHWAAF